MSVLQLESEPKLSKYKREPESGAKRKLTWFPWEVRNMHDKRGETALVYFGASLRKFRIGVLGCGPRKPDEHAV